MIGIDLPDMDSLSDRASQIEDKAALRIFKHLVRRASTDVLTSYGSDDLQVFIASGYPVVEEELPPQLEEALREIGPEYEQYILNELRADRVLYWMEDPSWHDDPEVAEEIRECYETIVQTAGGEEWLEDQIQALWHICLDYPEDGAGR